MPEWSQSVFVSVAQSYWNPAWDHERNHAVYGDLASPEGVGANWRVRFLREAELEPDWAPLVRDFKSAVDHVCFTTDYPEFRQKASTLENVALHLARTFGPLEIFETETLGCRVRGADFWLIERAYNLEGEARIGVDPLSGLARSRGEFGRACARVADDFATDRKEDPRAWAERLHRALGNHLIGLERVTIDLGSQRRIQVTTGA